MTEFTRRLTFAAVGLSLCVAPVGVVAASPAPSAVQPAVATQTVSPWLALSAMSTNASSYTAAAATAATAAAEGEGGMSSPWPAYVVIGLTVILGIYILAKG